MKTPRRPHQKGVLNGNGSNSVHPHSPKMLLHTKIKTSKFGSKYYRAYSLRFCMVFEFNCRVFPPES